MEIYNKDQSSPASKQFEKLLNSQLSKDKIEEGKIIDAKASKGEKVFNKVLCHSDYNYFDNCIPLSLAANFFKL